jgi:hypothetical protein
MRPWYDINVASPALNAPNLTGAAASLPTIYNDKQPRPQCTTCRTLISLPSKSPLHLLRPPIHLHLTLIHILINPLHPLANPNILPLALLEHLEHQIATDGRVIGVAKVLVHALLERLDALADFLGVVRVDQLLENGARVR